MLDAVLVTRIVVKTLVISSLRILNTPLPFKFCFSSSSANSLTFQGYSVVIAISAACSNAKQIKRNKNSDTDEMISSLFMGATGPLGPPAAIIANADGGDLISVVTRSTSGSNLPLRNGSSVLREFEVDAVLFLILFHSLLRIEGLSHVLVTAFELDAFLLSYCGKGEEILTMKNDIR
jgi:hypothetical protein